MSILGGSAKLQKANINFVLSVHKQHLGYHWMDFHEILYLRISCPKSVEKIQVLLKSDKNNGYSTWRPIYIFDYRSLKSSQSEKGFRQNLLKKKNTHFILSSFFRKSCHVWDNVEEYSTARQATDDNIAHAHCTLDT